MGDKQPIFYIQIRVSQWKNVQSLSPQYKD